MKSIKNITGLKVYHKPSKEIIKVKKDFLNGEILFKNGNLGRDEDVVVMEEVAIYIQTHQELISEFNSLIIDDKDFNYKKSEFVNWFFDCVYNLNSKI